MCGRRRATRCSALTRNDDFSRKRHQFPPLRPDAAAHTKRLWQPSAYIALTVLGVDRRERTGLTQRFGVAGSARGVLDLPPRSGSCPDSVSLSSGLAVQYLRLASVLIAFSGHHVTSVGVPVDETRLERASVMLIREPDRGGGLPTGD